MTSAMPAKAARLVAALHRLGAAEIFACAGPKSALVFAQLRKKTAPSFVKTSFFCGEIPFASPKHSLFSPEIAFFLEGDAVVPLLDLPGAAAAILADAQREPEVRPWQNALDYDAEPARALPRFVQACDWVGDSARRLTVARRVLVPKVDPVATFSLLSPRGRERALLRAGSSFYVGCSPELLAEGTREGFSCYKLSGTAPLGYPMQEDERLVREHESSIADTLLSLSTLGRLQRDPRQTITLPKLQHFETAIHCQPRPGTKTLDCIEAVRPVGASPKEEGLSLLFKIEEEPRGLYYGLSGFILPDGRFSFSQLLRTLFYQDGAWFAVVGAAVTALSTPALELEETRLKLSSIRFVPA